MSYARAKVPRYRQHCSPWDGLINCTGACLLVGRENVRHSRDVLQRSGADIRGCSTMAVPVGFVLRMLKKGIGKVCCPGYFYAFISFISNGIRSQMKLRRIIEARAMLFLL